MAPVLRDLAPVLSSGRIATYLAAAGHDPARALELYLWNVRLGEAFHLPVQAVEVAARNRIDAQLRHSFGHDWWNEPAFLRMIDGSRRADLAEVQKRLLRKGVPLMTGQIVAGLSFGFWVSLLGGRYNPPFWGAHLRTAFPDLPATIDRRSLEARLRVIATFRNRIWHHEPIFRDNASQRYSDCMEVLGWLCRSKFMWIKPECRVMAVLRSKP